MGQAIHTCLLTTAGVGSGSHTGLRTRRPGSDCVFGAEACELESHLSLWSSSLKSGVWTKAGWQTELPGALYLE